MMASKDQPEPVFNLNVTIFGKVGMVICWYFDGNADGYDDFKIASRLVRVTPALLGGRFHSMTEDDFYFLDDALGSFPHRDEDLDAVYSVVHNERRRRIRGKRRPK
jgi:hypothetical protein